jgi:hypothetical protein
MASADKTSEAGALRMWLNVCLECLDAAIRGKAPPQEQIEKLKSDIHAIEQQQKQEFRKDGEEEEDVDAENTRLQESSRRTEEELLFVKRQRDSLVANATTLVRRLKSIKQQNTKCEEEGDASDACQQFFESLDRVLDSTDNIENVLNQSVHEVKAAEVVKGGRKNPPPEPKLLLIWLDRHVRWVDNNAPWTFSEEKQEFQVTWEEKVHSSEGAGADIVENIRSRLISSSSLSTTTLASVKEGLRISVTETEAVGPNTRTIKVSIGLDEMIGIFNSNITKPPEEPRQEQQ